MTDTLDGFKDDYMYACQRMYAATKEAIYAEKALVEAWMDTHYPAIPCTVTIIEDNLLSLDIAFPGVHRATAKRLAQEIANYVSGLLEEGNLRLKKTNVL